MRDKKAEVFSRDAGGEAARTRCAASTAPARCSGKTVRGYREEPNVARGSNIETYVALKLEIDNWRWAGVPFYLRTGKHLARRMTEIAIRFKQAPVRRVPGHAGRSAAAELAGVRIQPDEGISLQFEVKRPGPGDAISRAVKMDFAYDDWFPPEPNVGYETLLYDVMIGDATLFQRADHGGGGLARRAARARCLGARTGRLPELRLRQRRAASRGRADRARRQAPLAADRRRRRARTHERRTRERSRTDLACCSPTSTARW